MSDEKLELNNIRGILFDMDGTLLETEILGCQAVFHTLKDHMSQEAIRSFEKRGYRMEWELKQHTLGLPDQKWPPIVFEWAKQHWGVQDPPTVEQFLEKWDSNMFQLMSGVEKCKGAQELVEQLEAKNLPMAIATSSRARAVEEKKKKHDDLFQKIQIIVTGDDPAVENGKPAPDIYIEAARRLNVEPSDCIVFEDGMTGVKAGKAAGCFVVAVPDARSTDEEKEKFAQVADIVLEDLTEIWNRVSLGV